MSDLPAPIATASPLVRKRKDIECEIAALTDPGDQAVYLDVLRYQTAALLGHVLARDARLLLRSSPVRWNGDDKSKWESAIRFSVGMWEKLFPQREGVNPTLTRLGPVIDIPVARQAVKSAG